MKIINSKITIATLLSLPLLVSSVFTPMVFAQVDTKAGFCTNVDTVSNRVLTAISNHETKLDQARTDTQLRYTQRWSTRDANLNASRAKWDTSRQQMYAKLDTKATTPEQKTAVAQFKTTVEAAVTTRKSAVDSAIKTYRDAVNQLLVDRVNTMDGAFTTFKATVTDDGSKAKSDCAAGTAPASVRQNYTTSVKTARESFRTSVQAKGEIRSSVDQLAATKKQAIDKAIADFKTTAEKARADLKTAFGK